MSTIIDTLLIQLGFDTKKMSAGQGEADKALGGVQKSAQKTGDTLDKMGKDGAQAIRGLAREAVAFFAVLTAGKSLKAFIQDNTMTNVALQNQARNLGVSVKALATWQGVARSLGGTASDVSGSMQSLVSQFQTVSGRQNLGRVFGQMHVSLMGANGQMRDMSKLIPDLAAAAQRMGPQLFSALGQQAGFSQGFINMLEHSPAQLEAMYKSLQQYSPTAADADASDKLLADWVKLTAQSEAFGRSIMTSLTPELDEMMGYVSGLVDKNQAWINQDIDQYATKIGNAIQAINWKQVDEDLKGIATGVDDIVGFMGGWKNATELLFALWVGSKFVAVLANIAILGRAAGLSSGAMMRLFGMAAGATATGAVVAPLVLSGDTANNAPAQSAQRAQTEKEELSYWGKYTASHPGIAPKGSQASLLKQGMAYFTSQGWTQAQSAGIMGNVIRESNLDPNAVNSKTGAYGLFQWLGDRKKALFAKYGSNPTAAQQFAFAQSELTGSESAAGNALRTTTNQYGASGIFNSKFERSNDDFSGIQKRMSDANIAMQAAMMPSGGSSNVTTIHAPITIHAPSGDPRPLARAVTDEIQKLQRQARQSNSGMQ